MRYIVNAFPDKENNSSSRSKTELESERTVPTKCLKTMNFRNQNLNFVRELNSSRKKNGLIYSHQWRTNVIEMQLLENRVIEFSSLSCSASSSTPSTTNESTDNEIQQKKPQLIIDVFGQETEPICTYYRCRHKFSLHGLSTHGCRCKHPTNKTLGILVKENTNLL